MMLSAARFVVQILMVGQVAEAVGAHISIWQLAAATPLVTLAYALALTPGGLGVTELGYAFALHLFGTPVAVAAQWALENRILVVASCLVIAGCGLGLLGIERVAGHGMRGPSKTGLEKGEIDQTKRGVPWGRNGHSS